MDRYTGIWIDKREAIIFDSLDDFASARRVHSDIKIGNAKGGARSSTPYGPQDAVSESKVLEKKKSALHHFYLEVMDSIENPKMVLLLGPGMTKNELGTEIEESHSFKDVPVYIQTLDSLTENQIRAEIKKFYISRLS